MKKDPAASAGLLEVQTSSSDCWSPYLTIEIGVAHVTLVVAVVMVVGAAVAVADAALSEVGNSLMDAVVEVAFVVAAAADLSVVHKRQDNFGSWKVGTGDTRTWAVAFAAVAGRKVVRLDHGFERMLLKRENSTEVCDRRTGTAVAFGWPPSDLMVLST